MTKPDFTDELVEIVYGVPVEDLEYAELETIGNIKRLVTEKIIQKDLAALPNGYMPESHGEVNRLKMVQRTILDFPASRPGTKMTSEQFTPGRKDTYEEGYDHPIRAICKQTKETMSMRIMGRDEMPDDGITYYVDTDCSIYQLHELEIVEAQDD